MKWLNSLDELLYEVMSWILFFPITLWRATVHPLRTMSEIEAQALLPEKEQYSAVLSPPLFLALSLLLAHTASTAMGQTDALIANRHGLASLITDNASALVLRIALFASFPLFLAARLVRQRGVSIDRLSLRQPFYELCYPAAVFALGVSLGASLAATQDAIVRSVGQVVMVASLVQFCVVATGWFATLLPVGTLRAFGNVTLGLLQGILFLVLMAFLFSH